MRAGAAEFNRIAVRPRAGSPASTDAPVRSTDVFDDNGLSMRVSNSLGHNSSHDIGGAACSIRYDHGDGARRIGLCKPDPRHGRHGGSAGCHMQKLTAWELCCFDLKWVAVQAVAPTGRRCVGRLFDPIGGVSTFVLRRLLLLTSPSFVLPAVLYRSPSCAERGAASFIKRVSRNVPPADHSALIPAAGSPCPIFRFRR
jgi:hypothetical protein